MALLHMSDDSTKKGHTYRIVVSDLLRQRPIWFGGTDRSEASLDQFYARGSRPGSSWTCEVCGTFYGAATGARPGDCARCDPEGAWSFDKDRRQVSVKPGTTLAEARGWLERR